jgi:hypothetical protein
MVFSAKSRTPSSPAEGTAAAQVLMFSLPFGSIVIRTRSPQRFWREALLARRTGVMFEFLKKTQHCFVPNEHALCNVQTLKHPFLMAVLSILLEIQAVFKRYLTYKALFIAIFLTWYNQNGNSDKITYHRHSRTPSLYSSDQDEVFIVMSSVPITKFFARFA